MISLLLASTSEVTYIFVTMGLLVAFSVVACWRAWGVDIHKHLEAEGIAYDELHPEERAEQERREAAYQQFKPDEIFHEHPEDKA